MVTIRPRNPRPAPVISFTASSAIIDPMTTRQRPDDAGFRAGRRKGPARAPLGKMQAMHGRAARRIVERHLPSQAEIAPAISGAAHGHGGRVDHRAGGR